VAGAGAMPVGVGNAIQESPEESRRVSQHPRRDALVRGSPAELFEETGPFPRGEIDVLPGPPPVRFPPDPQPGERILKAGAGFVGLGHVEEDAITRAITGQGGADPARPESTGRGPR